MSQKYHNYNIFFSQLVIEEFIRNQINHFCISPGSRSSPLTIVVGKHPEAKSSIFYDERAAGFYALGYARATGKPAILICTSGTALANYFPSIIEAAQDNIPMIILSADRPPELQETAANQTIVQTNIYGRYAKWQFNFDCPDEKIVPQQILTTINQAVYQSMCNSKGVVHLNCMFREPLVTEEEVKLNFSNKLKQWKQKKTAYTTYIPSIQVVENVQFENIAQKILSARKILLVVGKLDLFVDKDKLNNFIKKSGLLAYSDISANVNHEDTIHYFDYVLLRKELWKELVPDIIIHLGGRIVSKRYTQFVEENPPDEYIVVKDTCYRLDPAHIVTSHIQVDVNYFIDKLSKCPFKVCSQWRNLILNVQSQIKKVCCEAIFSNNELNEIFVTDKIAENALGITLFLANSMTIRYFDMYGKKHKLNVVCNRGVSGIDGNLATAIGVANGLEQPVTIVIGDLSLIHDLNSLSLLSKNMFPVYVIVLNNHGGSIFSHLPIAQYGNIFEKYFLTPHDFSFAKVAENFSVPYYCPKNREEFTSIYTKVTSEEKTCLVEVVTNYEVNLDIQNKVKQEIQMLPDFTIQDSL